MYHIGVFIIAKKIISKITVHIHLKNIKLGLVNMKIFAIVCYV